jgi:protein-disulfide isomerase
MRVIATIALALVTSAGLAAAQSSIPGTPERPSESLSPPPLTTPSSQIQLTAAQRTAIFDAVRQDGKQVAPGTDFVASIGGPVPPQLELYVLPDSALATVPDAKSVKYTVVHNQIVLVDPTTMRVVDIIPQ